MTGIAAIILLSLLTATSIEYELFILIFIVCMLHGCSEYLKSSYSLFLNIDNAIDTINETFEKIMVIALGIMIALYVGEIVLEYFDISI